MLDIRHRFVHLIQSGSYLQCADILETHPNLLLFDNKLATDTYQSALDWTLRSYAAPLWFIKLLVTHGASINKPCEVNRKEYPLDVVVKSAPEVIHYLLDEGAVGGDYNSLVQDVKSARKRCRETNIPLAWALKQQGVPKDLINQICEEFWELRTK